MGLRGLVNGDACFQVWDASVQREYLYVHTAGNADDMATWLQLSTCTFAAANAGRGRKVTYDEKIVLVNHLIHHLKFD